MPTIPVYQQRTRASGASLGAGPTSQGRELVAVGQALGNVVDAAQAAESADLLSDLRSRWTQRFIEAQSTAEADGKDFTANLLAEYDRDVQAATRRTRWGGGMVKEGAQAFREQLAQKAMLFEAQTRVNYRTTSMEHAIERTSGVVELDPDSWQFAAAEQMSLIERLALPPEQRLALARKLDQQVTEAAVRGYVRQDPEAALQRLINPQESDLLFRALSSDQRQVAYREIEAQQRIRLAEEERAYRDAQRALKQEQDEASKDGDRLLGSGQLSAAWIERNRERLSPEDYRYFYRALTSGGDAAPANPVVYSDLRERASFGQDIRADARDALHRGQIRLSDYDRLLSEVESARPNWYKRGAQYISTAAAVSDLNPDPAAAQRKAQMLDEWDEWAIANPQATEEQARQTYRRIVSEYALVDYEKMTLIKRSPRFLVGSRSQPDFDSTKQATVEAYQRGEITEQELNEQAALIREWEESWRQTQMK